MGNADAVKRDLIGRLQQNPITKAEMYQLLVDGFAAMGHPLSEEKKKELRDTVEVEASGILNWMIEGAMKARTEAA